MDPDTNFGAGIFEEPKPVDKSESTAPSTSSHEENKVENAPEARASQEFPESEEEGSSDYFVQQERDREKAMLLRRTREESTQEPREQGGRPQGPPPRGNKWGNPRNNQDFNRRPRNSGGHSDFRGNQQSAPVAEPEFRNEPERPREEATFEERRTLGERRQGPAPGGVLVDQRVAIFVDVQNMYHSARKMFGRNLSYSKLIQNTVKGRSLIRAIAYLLDRQGVDQGGFLEHLGSCGFEVRRKELIERADGTRKGDWDMGIASDAIAISEKVDVIILVSGDGDFATLAQLLRTRGVKVEVASFRDSTAEALLSAADGFHSLGRESLY